MSAERQYKIGDKVTLTWSNGHKSKATVTRLNTGDTEYPYIIQTETNSHWIAYGTSTLRVKPSEIEPAT